jgi:hypothetical protein
VEQIRIKDNVFVASTPSGWTNNLVSLAWVEQLFDCYIKERSLRGQRLLVMDGYGSHITPEFIQYCDNHCILLAILPPYATHTLQPLDVGCFKPLSTAYANKLMKWTH